MPSTKPLPAPSLSSLDSLQSQCLFSSSFSRDNVPSSSPTALSPMALRLVDIYRPDDGQALTFPDNTYDLLGHWTYSLDDDQRVDRVLVDVDETEALIDWVDQVVTTDYRVTLQSVEATLPRPETEDEDDTGADDENENSSSSGRVGRE